MGTRVGHQPRTDEPRSEHEHAEHEHHRERNVARGILRPFGQAERDWVKSRLERGLKLILRHDLPFKPVIYAAPPTKAPPQLAFSFCDVLDGTNGFVPDRAAALLALGTPA